MKKLWNGWFTRFQRRHHEPTFLTSLTEVNHFRDLVTAQACLACRQQTVDLVSFERNPHGWEATITCRNCRCRGVVNSDGYSILNLNIRGKARE